MKQHIFLYFYFVKFKIIAYYFLIPVFAVLLSRCHVDKPSIRRQIDEAMNRWHRDVADLDEQAYFDRMAPDFVFVGTDPSEVWTKEEFRKFSHPFFVKGKTWDFKPLSRNVYVDDSGRYAWFDETLDTWMGVCRGSGVWVKTGGEWYIRHYVLSMAVSNDDTPKIIPLKREGDSLYINSLGAIKKQE